MVVAQCPGWEDVSAYSSDRRDRSEGCHIFNYKYNGGIRDMLGVVMTMLKESRGYYWKKDGFCNFVNFNIFGLSYIYYCDILLY